MSHSVRGHEAASYRGALLRSLAVHATVLLLILLALWVQRIGLHAQEEQFIADLREQEQSRVDAEQDAREELKRELAQDQVEIEIATLLADDVQTETLEALREQAEMSLRDLFAQWQDRQVSDVEMNQVREDVLAELQALAQDRLVAALVAQMRAYIHDELAPQTVREMENSLRDQGARKVFQQMRAFVQENKARDEAGAILEAALDSIHSELADDLSKEIQQTLVPAATQQVLDQFEQELSQLPVNTAELRELVAEDVLAAIADEMAQAQPLPETATLRTRADHGLDDGKRADAAKQQAATMQTRVEKLIERQQQVMAESDQTKAVEQQRELADDVAQIHEELRETGHEAQLQATGTQAWRLGRVTQLATYQPAINSSRDAVDNLERSRMDDARVAQQRTVEQLTELVEPLKATQEQLTEDAQRHHEQAAQRPEVASNETIHTQAEALTAAMEDDLEQASQESVAHAVKRLQPRNVLGEEFGEEVQAALELQMKLASAQQRMHEGRDLTSDGLSPSIAAMEIGNGGIPPNHLTTHHFNREAYERFVQDLKNRSDPGNAYGDSGPIEDLATRASGATADVPKTVFLTTAQREAMTEEKDEEPQQRELVTPDFAAIAYAAAPMQNEPLKIDGDLSDWGELTQPIRMKWYADDEHNTFEGGTPLYLRWSREGLYFAYHVDNAPSPRVPNSQSPYSGDVLEVWLDMENSRDTTMLASQYAHQFIFTPFGLNDTKGTFVEYGRGARGMRSGWSYVDDTEQKGVARARREGTGYTVEAFIPRSTLAKPVLTPGSYLAMNFSINKGSFGGKVATQWSASKALGTFTKPDTWGDVLLLGADATVTLTGDEADGQTPHVVIGKPLRVQVTDRDMNIRPDLRDRVAGSLLTGEDGAPLLVILEETGLDTGVFEASVDTQAFFRAARASTLNVRQGDWVTFEYRDPRAAFGEADRVVSARIPVAWAVYGRDRVAQSNP